MRPSKHQNLYGLTPCANRGRTQLSANPQIANTTTVIDVEIGTISNT